MYTIYVCVCFRLLNGNLLCSNRKLIQEPKKKGANKMRHTMPRVKKLNIIKMSILLILISNTQVILDKIPIEFFRKYTNQF